MALQFEKSSLRQPGRTALQRPKYRSTRAFYLVILTVSVIAAWSIVAQRIHPGGGENGSKLMRRFQEETANSNKKGHVHEDQECRLVHHANDMCAFVRQNCPDEEAGLFSYLQLYYCRLPKAKPVAFVIMVVWLGLLFSTIGIAASDFFCVNLSTISSILGMSESMAGVTFLAFGNGSPDVFSTFAAMRTHSGSLAIGELIGAAGFITAVVAGSMALVRPFKVAKRSFVRDVGFFIVASSFSMVFLADGYLQGWECTVMVGFYVFYVVTVVVWHWYLSHRGRMKRTEAAARGHFHVPGSEEAEGEPYRDEEEDEEGAADRSKAPLRGVSADDFAALERGNNIPFRPSDDQDPDEDDQTRDHWLAEISNNMRISRPRPGSRRDTYNPIRPSLVGALEFRAVLSSLQKSRNLQTIPINLRRYSDDPSYTLAQQQGHLSTMSNPEINCEEVDAREVAVQGSMRPITDSDRTSGTARARAVSANDAAGLQFDPGAFEREGRPVPDIDLLSASPPDTAALATSAESARSSRVGSGLSTPRLSIQPPYSDFGYLATSPGPISAIDSRSPHLLAPPGEMAPSFSDPPAPGERNHPRSDPHSHKSPTMSVPRPSKSQMSSPASPFPEYHDDPNYQPPSRAPSIRLPPPGISPESTFRNVYYEPGERPIRWWPYKVLPPPQILASTLFPTLYSWNDKNVWEKMLGIVSAPSVFLLVITLPVVESEKDEEDTSASLDLDPSLPSPDLARSRSQSTNILIQPPERTLPNTANSDANGPDSAAANQDHHGNHGVATATPSSASKPHPVSYPPNPATDPQLPSSPKDWNRWLVATQIFTAPLFIVLLLWANTSSTFSQRTLLLDTLYSLLASLLAFTLLVLTTTPSKPPRYRPLLCFLGFIVSIAWISTIANEVVGVLKALGVILGISDAILGLTIFAVGNSLGDLVADITVARLGYPVMALSACFGGPMLNILLGIGVSGLYMTLQGGRKWAERHPGREVKYKPYAIEVSGTLVISGVTLLVTLLGLLVAVPLNGWWMDRRIGWALVAVWCVSTVGNVGVEIAGVGRETS